MATITPPTRVGNLDEYQRRVRSPLARLRGYIRAYVGLEGALMLVLLLAVCFWAGLILDYGVFKLFAFDWVQDWHWSVRLVLFLAATAVVLTVVAVMVLGRLTREFRDPALALVLERRFPKLLGDRLITAVELSDLRRAAEQGYSPAMVLQTIHEAAERVQQVPVAKAFDWRRLIRRGLLALGLTLGLYILAGGLFLTIDLIGHVHSGRVGYSRFNEVVQMWFERDVFMRHTLWPRRAQLQLVNVPEKGLRVGQGDTVPQVRMRALEYVVADPDPNSRDGWRAVQWTELAGLIGGDVPASLPYSLAPHEGGGEVTVDQVALEMRKFDVRHGSQGWQLADPKAAGGWRSLMWADLRSDVLGGLTPPANLADWDGKPAAEDLTVDAVEEAVGKVHDKPLAGFPDADVIVQHLDSMAAVHDVMDRVNARAAQPEMSRTMRRLDVPATVQLYGAGGINPPRAKLDRNSDNEYSYDFKDLKESITFTVQADDFFTPRRAITMVPPPGLTSLNVQENRPAYLFYRPSDETTLAFLRGKKQPFQTRNILEVGTDQSRLDVPAGTDLVLNGAATKDLSEAVLILPAKNADDLPELRVRIDPSNVQAGEQSSRFFGIEAPLTVKRALDDPRSVIVQSTKKGDAVRLPIEVGSARRGFQVELSDVRRSLSFALEFTDADGVKGTTKVDVVTQPDAAPVLQEVNIVGLRSETKTNAKGERKTYFLVTAKARIPVAARVADDHCLGNLLYQYSLTPVTPTPAAAPATGPEQPGKPETQVHEIESTPPLFTAGAVGFLGSPHGQGPLLAASALIPAKIIYSYSPPEFQDRVREAGDGLALSEVQKLLAQPQQLPFRAMMLKRDAEVRADTINVGYDAPKAPKRPTWQDAQDPNNKLRWDFPLWGQNLVLDDDHPFYRMDFWLEAADTVSDEPTPLGGSPQPHRSKSKDTYTFLVVRDNYLMGQIGQDEAQQFKVLNTQFQNIGGLTTDFEAFKSEAAAFDKRLKQANDVQTSSDLLAFVQEVSDQVGLYHKVNDVEKFLLSSPGYLALDARVKDAIRTNKQLQQELDDNPRNPDEIRQQMQANEDLKDSVHTLAALLEGARDEKSALTQIVEKVNSPGVKVTELLAQDVWAGNIEDTLTHALEALRKADGVVPKYEGLVREEQLNVIDKDTIDYTQKRIVDKLHEIVKFDFPRAQDAVGKFRKALPAEAGVSDQERIDRSREAAQGLQKPMTRLIADVNEVLEAIRRGENRQSLKEKLTKIDIGVQAEAKYAKDVQKYLEDKIFNP